MKSRRNKQGAGRVVGLKRQLMEAEKHAALAREEAERLASAKEEWLANITHELRTPMHGIISFARFGMKNVQHAERGKLAQYFEQINTSAERLMSLLNDLLDLSRSTNTKQVYVFERHDIMDLLNAVVLEYNAAVREKSLVLEYAHQEVDTEIVCDEARIRQVLGNVLVNAIKYSPGGGRLLFSFGEEPAQGKGGALPDLVVTLRDEGVGIPEDELEAVFDQFRQSRRTRSRAGGTGLGLAICREIVRAHGGDIRALNNTDSAGCTLYIRLPREQKQGGGRKERDEQA